MPMRGPSVCGHCGKLNTVCACRRALKAAYDANRPTAAQRGYGSKWQRESKAFLALPQNRFCACGCGRIADMVDHVIPHRGNPKLFWDRSNWQPLAGSPCHSSRKQSLERAS